MSTVYSTKKVLGLNLVEFFQCHWDLMYNYLKIYKQKEVANILEV